VQLQAIENTVNLFLTIIYALLVLLDLYILDNYWVFF